MLQPLFSITKANSQVKFDTPLYGLTEYVSNGGHIIFWPKAGFYNEFNAYGKRIDYYLNYSGAAQTFNLQPENTIDLLFAKPLQKNSMVVLKPWNVLITGHQ